MREYLIASAASVPLTALLELLVLRTGLFRKRAYWITMAVVLGFQVPVDGWLTKLDAPIVVYADWAASGLRFPWDIPVEDFLFGFSMVTVTLLLWERARARKTEHVDAR
ncbi:lycopene cyclase domain-containing protein [Actinosynnema pretiosum]|uniref:Lycopene cyclase n=1 Tax=Actinosynnema pretiosum TaxID=42197 RepID=A0A290Z831_9PSEU|nr:lycopene cyclase domain-containing protein [Actinosynnema pretiosum]ATE55132.1 lycopene cyclase [Actinosynnema pretiosum]